MLENIKWILNNIFLGGSDFVIRKNISFENIETMNGVAVEDKSTHTCALCTDSILRLI